jgi:hypothetical protein
VNGHSGGREVATADRDFAGGIARFGHGAGNTEFAGGIVRFGRAADAAAAVDAVGEEEAV